MSANEGVERRSRRDLLKTLSAAAAGAVAGGVLNTEVANADHGVINAASDSDRPAIHGHNTWAEGGPGVEGSSNEGIGVRGKVLRRARSLG
jgi:hypothetical protein